MENSPVQLNTFQIEKLHKEKNISKLNEFNKMNFTEIEAVYCLLDDYFSNNDDTSLQIAKNKLNSENFNIKGTLEKYIINNKEDINKYDFELVLRKINIKSSNFSLNIEEAKFNQNDKYHIKFSNIDRETKSNFKKSLDVYYKPILVITNLEAYLDLNEIQKYIIKFKNTNNTKIYLEINKIFEQIKDKKVLKSSISFPDIFLKNNFNSMEKISYKKLKEKQIKKFCKSIQCFYDIKNFLEIETEALYVENLKNEFYNGYLLKTYNIDICCLVKKISNVDNYLKRKNNIFITLENIFDLNTIILEVPNTHELLKDLMINCIYLFKNLICFIDENFNVKFGVQKLDTNNCTKLGIYSISDFNEYSNNKIKNLFNMKFNHLISLTTENKLIRTLQKYLVFISNVMYVNAHLLNNKIFYEGCLIASDGTSSGFFLIEQDCVKNLFKFDSKFEDYIRGKLYQEKKVRIFPGYNDNNFNDYYIQKVYGNQVIIIGIPKMNRLLEMSAQDMYENISELKKFSGTLKEHKLDGFLKFDTQLTKTEFSMINGSFSKKSDKLEKLPYIKSYFLFNMNDYIKLNEKDNKINKI